MPSSKLLFGLSAAATLAAAQDCTVGNAFPFTLREVGQRNTLDWRVWLQQNDSVISFWHDVPLWPDDSDRSIVNMVVEIPRWVDGKIEIKRDEPLNPIFHDSRNDQPRFVESVWPHKSYPFLYGSIPQTWESPNFNHSFTGEPGDNDPVDVFDIGQDVGFVGQVKQVKVLGALALNDGGETDWKVLAVDVNDPLAPLVNTYQDVEQYRPGLLKSFRDWFTYYKVARGDGLIEIVGDAFQNSSFIQSIIAESHESWLELIRGEVDSNEINFNQTSRPGAGDSYLNASSTVTEFDIPPRNTSQAPAPKPARFNDWYYLNWDFTLVELPETNGTC